jgi:hypothetical protein
VPRGILAGPKHSCCGLMTELQVSRSTEAQYFFHVNESSIQLPTV